MLDYCASRPVQSRAMAHCCQDCFACEAGELLRECAVKTCSQRVWQRLTELHTRCKLSLCLQPTFPDGMTRAMCCCGWG